MTAAAKNTSYIDLMRESCENVAGQIQDKNKTEKRRGGNKKGRKEESIEEKRIGEETREEKTREKRIGQETREERRGGNKREEEEMRGEKRIGNVKHKLHFAPTVEYF